MYIKKKNIMHCFHLSKVFVCQHKQNTYLMYIIGTLYVVTLLILFIWWKNKHFLHPLFKTVLYIFLVTTMWWKNLIVCKNTISEKGVNKLIFLYMCLRVYGLLAMGMIYLLTFCIFCNMYLWPPIYKRTIKLETSIVPRHF